MDKFERVGLSSTTEMAPSPSRKVESHRIGRVVLGAIMLYAGSMTTSVNAASADAGRCLFHADFEEGAFPQAWRGKYEVKKPGVSLRISNDARAGNYGAEFTVRKGDWVAGGTRSEATFDSENKEGVEEWVAWSFKIPTDFEDSRLRNSKGVSNWQILGQWHVQPDKRTGETWDTWRGKSSPSIALSYMYLDEADSRVQKILGSSDKREKANQIFGFTPDLVNHSVIAFHYGVPPKVRAVYPIKKGVWYDVLVHIRWSQSSEGSAGVRINGEPMSDGEVSGVNMYNAASHYFKVGMYRNPDIPHSNSVLYDEICISRSPE